MKVYKKIILDKNNKVIYEDSYDYKGNWSYLGIHYTYGANKGSKLMEKKAKREKQKSFSLLSLIYFNFSHKEYIM